MNFHSNGCAILFEVALEVRQSLGHCLQAGEVVWGEHLALYDREVDFDLVEPTCVDRAMNRNDSRMGVRQTPYRSLATVRRAVVHDPEHAARGVVRRLAHDLIDQATERCDASGRFAAPEHLRAVDASAAGLSPQAPPRASACSTRIDSPGAVSSDGYAAGPECWSSRRWRGRSSTSRSACPCQRRSYKSRMRAALAWNCEIAGKDPAAMLPGADGVLVQPTPHRTVADASREPVDSAIPRPHRHARPDGKPEVGRQLAGQRLDLNRELSGGEAGVQVYFEARQSFLEEALAPLG